VGLPVKNQFLRSQGVKKRNEIKRKERERVTR